MYQRNAFVSENIDFMLLSYRKTPILSSFFLFFQVSKEKSPNEKGFLSFSAVFYFFIQSCICKNNLLKIATTPLLPAFRFDLFQSESDLSG
jgi:hypothetical protein